MKLRRIIFVLGSGILLLSITLWGSDPRTDFETQLNNVIARLNHEADADAGAPLLLSEVIQREYGTGVGDLKWARDHAVS